MTFNNHFIASILPIIQNLVEPHFHYCFSNFIINTASNSRKLSIYRIVQVNWRSASVSPNCSVYFHFMHAYKMITFELDDTFLEACIQEEIIRDYSLTSIQQAR